MTVAKIADAPSTRTQTWQSIKWTHVDAQVNRLQMRIAKAVREKRWRKATSLQWLLTHSYHAKLLAIKRVTSSKGAKTPGIDGCCWLSPNQKMNAVTQLKRRGYQSEPLKRVLIPKKNGKMRPLGIPCMKDRAMQALHMLALLPIAETLADHHSYGFRPKRSTADAIDRCFMLLSRRKHSAQWILEGDIEGCFDHISHDWLLHHVPMDKQPLKSWLQSGYLEKQLFYPTQAGTPQGGVISPTLANMALDGLEQAVKESLPYRSKKQPLKVHVIRYADDFVITGESKSLLQDVVKPAVERFLATRGLRLSQEKTRITSIHDGFDFLGFNVRKYRNTLLIKPSKTSIKSLLDSAREIFKIHRSDKTEVVIHKLNNKLRGWAYYFRFVVAGKAFKLIDHCMFEASWRYARFRHWGKSCRWVKKKYYRVSKRSDWTFFAPIRNKTGKMEPLDLFKASYLPIKRHPRLKISATPFNPDFRAHFAEREEAMRRINHGYWQVTDKIDYRDMWTDKNLLLVENK